MQVITWLKKLYLDCKNIDVQVRSGRPKVMDFEAVLWAIEANTSE